MYGGCLVFLCSCSRLSSGGSDEDGVAIDHALIHMNLQDTHSSSDEEDTNSSDDEK